MHATAALAISVAALVSMANAQDLLSVTIYSDEACINDPLTLTTQVAENFCFANIGPVTSFGNVDLGINCDAGTAMVTTYTDNSCSTTGSVFGPDFDGCTEISFNSIELSCNQINGFNSTES